MDSMALSRAVGRLTNTAPPAGIRGGAGGVTIAIPNWNHEVALLRSVRSALNGAALLREQHVPAEVLVIDDFSRDGSVPLLRQLEALHYTDGLRVIALSRNVGLPTVRNLALRTASHQYLAFLDADNELVDGNLPAFYRSIVATEAAVVYGNLIQRGTDSAPCGLYNNESFQHRMFDTNYIDAMALLDRFQVSDAGGYVTSVEFQACEDWELYMHLAASGRRLVFVPMVFGIYHDLPFSMIKDPRDGGVLAHHARRAFDQLGIRKHLPLNTLHLRYHPEIGYL